MSASYSSSSRRALCSAQRRPNKTRVLRRAFIAGAVTTFGLWASPVAVDSLASLGAPTEAHAINGPSCGPSMDGARVTDTAGRSWECSNTGPGEWFWIQVA